MRGDGVLGGIAEISETVVARFVTDFMAEQAAGGCSSGGSGSWVIISAMVLVNRTMRKVVGAEPSAEA